MDLNNIVNKTFTVRATLIILESMTLPSPEELKEMSGESRHLWLHCRLHDLVLDE